MRCSPSKTTIDQKLLLARLFFSGLQLYLGRFPEKQLLAGSRVDKVAIWLLIRDQTASFLYFDISCKDYRESEHGFSSLSNILGLNHNGKIFGWVEPSQAWVYLKKIVKSHPRFLGEPLFEGFSLFSILNQMARAFVTKLKEYACWCIVDGKRECWGLEGSLGGLWKLKRLLEFKW